ncbi:hypothetical protein COU78_05430 [Candidatus Peregrinibacteria bacterium CG10_big_fil_rev_8_21_14_0_10_49_24]|nr:MAG: hypothetical protein COV83_01800 [Candidatus Peregrinibacteria bacterium CG11_big_fil_rev_8_21_14_0_20_49_14]PIR50786.1 MAG: hypothetical protein COU78_05430 [Candidatus Peregrinibacteria bacterium CG10_big_fil_rev_8_21_14_0_10_49_24]
MPEWESGLNQLTTPIADTLLYLPRKTIETGKDIALGAPEKALRGIVGISLRVARLPLMALLNIPFLPHGTNIGKIHNSTRMKYREILQGAGR